MLASHWKNVSARNMNESNQSALGRTCEAKKQHEWKEDRRNMILRVNDSEGSERKLHDHFLFVCLIA